MDLNKTRHALESPTHFLSYFFFRRNMNMVILRRASGADWARFSTIPINLLYASV